MKRKDGPKAPFEVVGLQQAWTEEGLALYACLVAPQEPSAQSHEAAVSSSIYTWELCKLCSALSTRLDVPGQAEMPAGQDRAVEGLPRLGWGTAQ